MQTRSVIRLVFVIALLLRFATALIPSRAAHHTTETVASQPIDPTAAMADAEQQFRQAPDNFRTSRGGEVMMSDGSRRELGDNPADQAIRNSFADRTQAEIDEVWGPAPVRHHTPGPGEPMMDPTPSR